MKMLLKPGMYVKVISEIAEEPAMMKMLVVSCNELETTVVLSEFGGVPLFKLRTFKNYELSFFTIKQLC